MFFIRYAAGKPARLVLQDECGRDPIPKGVGKTPFGEEQHSSGNGNQTAAPHFLLSGSCMLSVPGRIGECSVAYCVTGCAVV